MSEWQPIETYDALPKLARPEYAVFYFRAEPGRNGNKGIGLGAIVEMTRIYGYRVCTHWMPLPPPPGGIGREGE